MARRAPQSRPEPAPSTVRRTLWISLLALAAFLATLIVRLPARWVLPAARPALRCLSLEGSIWNGDCAGATVSGTPLGDLTWQLRPARLFGGQLAARVWARRARASARAEVALGLGGTLTARHVRIDLPLDPTLLPMLPRQISGTAQVRLSRLALARNGAVRQIQGRIAVYHLVDSSGQRTPLGSFAVTFPGGPGEPVGHLRDLGGPLAVEGTLRLTGRAGYDLRVRVAARAQAAPSLVNALRYLGTPDAEGWRPFALAGPY